MEKNQLSRKSHSVPPLPAVSGSGAKPQFFGIFTINDGVVRPYSRAQTLSKNTISLMLIKLGCVGRTSFYAY